MVFKPVLAEEILTFRSGEGGDDFKESVYIARSLYIAFANCHKDLPFLAFLSKSSFIHFIRKDQPSPTWNSTVVLSSVRNSRIHKANAGKKIKNKKILK